MTPLLEAARDLQDFFISRQWRFCIIGGLALLRWGEPRFTRDVDVSLFCGFGHEEDFIVPILTSGYRGRIADAAGFAQAQRVLLIESSGGVPIDIALAGFPFEEAMVERASWFEFEPGCSLLTCSAEDLVILKLFAFRPQDVLDVETVVLRQRHKLDWARMETYLAPLADVKGEPAIMKAFARLRDAT
jgi:hypothetical protein